MRRLALFAHYDAAAKVRPFILHFLRELRTVCDDIVFVSTAPLAESEIDRARPFAARVMTKENVGFDFGMWRDAMASVDVSSYDELVLTNSSVFGPVFSLSRVFAEMERVACDAWGMTDNEEIAWHLQSYFLVLRAPVAHSQLLRDFFASVLPYRDKEQLIRSYEVGLSRLLLDHGFHLHARVSEGDLRGSLLPLVTARRDMRAWWSAAARRAGLPHPPINPTTTQPVELLRAGMPFVKVELLRDNPRSIPLLPVLREMQRLGFDMSMLEFDRPLKPLGVSPELLRRVAREGKGD